jgi:hypothetical protein
MRKRQPLITVTCVFCIVACAATSPRPSTVQKDTAPSPVSPQQAHPNHFRVSGPTSVAECAAKLGQCKHPDVGVASICYGRSPGPDAPTSERQCVCHACAVDEDCGARKKCAWISDTCSAPVRLCLNACESGKCPDHFQCGEGFCVPEPGPKPP